MTTPTHAPVGPTPSDRLSIAYVAIFLAALTPLFVPPVLPMVDYYDHIARFYVLSHLNSDPFLAQNYAPRWAILPNIGMDVLGASLAFFVPPKALAKVLIILIFAVQYFGLLYLNRKLTGRNSLFVAMVGVALLYSFIFTWGFANFLLGLGLALWGAGWWLATRRRLAVAIPTGMAIALLIFLAHGFAFGLYGLLVGGLEIGLFLTARPRSIVSLGSRLAGLAMQAVAPALLFRASATIKASEGVTNADEAVKRLVDSGGLAGRLADLAIYRLTTVLRVSEGPALWFDVLTNAILVGAVAFLMRGRRLRLTPVAIPALLIGIVAFLLMPPALFGVGYVGDRIPLFVALVATAALSVRPDDSRLYRLTLSLVAATIAVKLAALAWSWIPYREDYRAYEQVRQAMPLHSVVAYSNLANSSRLDTHRRCEMFGQLLATSGYAAPLFVIPTAQPFVMIGPLRTATTARPQSMRGHASLNRALNRLNSISQAARFDYVMVCEPVRVGVGPSEERTLVAQSGRFALFKLTPRGSRHTADSD